MAEAKRGTQKVDWDETDVRSWGSIVDNIKDLICVLETMGYHRGSE